MKILITGGAGYIGSVLVPLLLEKKYQVTVIDNNMYGCDSLINYFIDPNFRFIKHDIRDINGIKDELKKHDAIIHLAAIVGYPACKKFPILAEEVNFNATVKLNEALDKSVPIIYGSTGSNYGAVTDQICKEDTPLNPLTVYGVTKTKAEMYMLENRENVVCYRFATAFGGSNRMRFDLLINDFVYQAVKNKNLVVYEKNFKRTFIHVQDIAKSFIFAIDNFSKMKSDVFNVGVDTMNYSKEEICYKIKDKIKFYLHFADFEKDEDERNYIVSYDKILKTGFRPEITIDSGIDELIDISKILHVKNRYSNV